MSTEMLWAYEEYRLDCQAEGKTPSLFGRGQPERSNPLFFTFAWAMPDALLSGIAQYLELCVSCIIYTLKLCVI